MNKEKGAEFFCFSLCFFETHSTYTLKTIDIVGFVHYKKDLPGCVWQPSKSLFIPICNGRIIIRPRGFP